MIKSSLLSFALSLVVFAGFAQTSSTLSNNKPTTAGDGYLFDFKGTNANNCPNKIPYDQWFIPPAYTVNSMGSDTLVVSTDGTQLGWHRLNLRFNDGNCNDATINLANNQNVEVIIRSTVAVPQCLIMFFNGTTGTEYNPLWHSLNVGLNTLTFSDIDFRIDATTKFDSTAISSMGISFRTSWDDNDGGASPTVTGTFHIASIKVGDQTGLSTTTGVHAQDITSEINAFPTPCSGTLNVNYDHNENGMVYISSLTGNNMMSTPVEAGAQNVRLDVATLPKGMYILTVKTDNAVGTQKIIVE